MTTGMDRLSGIKCAAARRLGPQLSIGAGAPGVVSRHAASCLRCQAELARYRRQRRELAGLAASTEAAPAVLVQNVESAIWTMRVVEASISRSRSAVAAAAGAMAAAASIIAIAAWRRGHSAA